MRFWVGLCGVLLVVASSACGKDAREHLAAGDKLSAAGDPRGAVVHYKNAVDANPQSGEALHKLAQAYASLNDSRQALGAFVRAADLLPRDAAVQLDAIRAPLPSAHLAAVLAATAARRAKATRGQSRRSDATWRRD